MPETAGMATLGLYSCAGRLMDEVQVEAGMNSLTYDVSTYPAGVYFITMTDGSNMTSARVVVE